MNRDVQASRLRVSRRRALALGGTVGLGGLIAACGGNGPTGAAVTESTAASATTGADGATVAELLAQAPNCVMSVEETQGPYWFDVDSIRTDIREDRPGTKLQLALRVQDVTGCPADGSGASVVSGAVVEIWHCDAGGVYSGFESGSNGGGGGRPPEGAPDGGIGGPPPGDGNGPPEGGGAPGGMGSSGETSNGSYSVGDSESATTDDGTYLRGAQPTDADGIAQFTTIFPGWYRGRTTHIHVKVHVDKKTVLTTQLFFDEALIDEINATSPYNEHTGRESNTDNSNDNIYDDTGLMTVGKQGDGYLAVINLGVDV
ncbi:protocatechuate dioxygenase [Rhodococcus sp. NPDC058521]|uniref:protocatechuate dioxygenase n=1 Tax=Rhodococcus sp. NPDC058521 TaxID=3346536 RepID=UPI00364ACC18